MTVGGSLTVVIPPSDEEFVDQSSKNVNTHAISQQSVQAQEEGGVGQCPDAQTDGQSKTRRQGSVHARWPLEFLLQVDDSFFGFLIL